MRLALKVNLYQCELKQCTNYTVNTFLFHNTGCDIKHAIDLCVKALRYTLRTNDPGSSERTAAPKIFYLPRRSRGRLRQQEEMATHFLAMISEPIPALSFPFWLTMERSELGPHDNFKVHTKT